MRETEPGSAREEAERLLASVLATARQAATSQVASEFVGDALRVAFDRKGRSAKDAGAGASTKPNPGRSGGHFATGGADCCVCPVCRGISALRDPDPAFAARLATGAGDFAAGVTSLLRAFSTAGTAGSGAATADEAQPETPKTSPASKGPAPTSRPAPDGDVWQAATRAGQTD